MQPRNSIFQKNLKALESSQPELAARVKQHSPSPQYEMFLTQSGAYSLMIHETPPVYFHDRSDPIAEAKNQLKQIDMESPSTLIVMGFGLGYLLEMLWDSNKSKFTAYLLIECDLSLFSYFLQYRDWTTLLTDPRVKIVVSDWPEEVPTAAQALLPQIMGSGVQFLEHTQSVEYYDKFYKQVYEQLRRFLRQASAESEFLARHGALIQRNTIANIPAILKSHGLESFKNQFNNQPAVLIAAGPSLTKNLHQLVEYQERVLLFCVDTAYRIALKHEIIPHFAAATDPTELNEKHFEGIPPSSKTTLLYESDVYPSIPLHWQSHRIFINSTKAPINQWIESTIGPYGTFEQSLTVAHALFTAATHMGCSPIVLIGFDLAFPREGGTTHAQGAALNRKLDHAKVHDTQLRIHGTSFHQDDTLESITWVDGVDGNMVPTSKTMAVFLQTLSASIQKCTSKVYDATEGGALIQGSIPVLLNEILPSLQTTTQLADLVSQLPPPPVQTNRIFNEIDRLSEGLAHVMEKSREALYIIQQIIPSLSQSQQHPNLAEKWKRMDSLFWDIYRNTAMQTVMSQALFPAMFVFIRQEKNETQLIRVDKYRKVFETVIQLGEKFEELLGNVRKQVLSMDRS